jgi:hypothetical protein
VTDVIFNEGAQSLRHVPQDRLGRTTRVASAAYTIVDLRYGEESSEREVASGSATIGSVDTVLTAAAGPAQTDPKRIAVTSSVGILPGRRYVIEGTDGATEPFVALRVETNTVYAMHELERDYAATASVLDVEIAADFPADEAADENVGLRNGAGPYQVTWEYTIAERLYLVPEIVWMTRTSVQPFITEVDVLRAYPTLVSRLHERATVLDAIRVAHEDYCVFLRAAGKHPADYRASDIARVAVRCRALEHALRWCQTDRDDLAADRFAEQWLQLMNSLTVGQPKTDTVTVDRDTNTAEAGGDKKYGNAYFVRS